MRRLLRRTSEVAAVRQALREGAITEDTIRGFVSILVQDLRIGQQLPHELALAALAVALETRPTDFVEEYLYDLSRLRLAELSMCIRVARECLKYRTAVAQNKTRNFSLVEAPEKIPFSLESSPWDMDARNAVTATTQNLVFGPK